MPIIPVKFNASRNFVYITVTDWTVRHYEELSRIVTRTGLISEIDPAVAGGPVAAPEWFVPDFAAFSGTPGITETTVSHLPQRNLTNRRENFADAPIADTEVLVTPYDPPSGSGDFFPYSGTIEYPDAREGYAISVFRLTHPSFSFYDVASGTYPPGCVFAEITVESGIISLGLLGRAVQHPAITSGLANPIIRFEVDVDGVITEVTPDNRENFQFAPSGSLNYQYLAPSSAVARDGAQCVYWRGLFETTADLDFATIRVRAVDTYGQKSCWCYLVAPSLRAPSLDILYDIRTGELRTLYADGDALRCARNLILETPTLDSSQSLLSEDDAPGKLLLDGAQVYAVSRDCKLYFTPDQGHSWIYHMTILAGAQLLGAAISPDGAGIYVMASLNDATTRAVVRRVGASGGGSAWKTLSSGSVSGLPDSLTAGALFYDGARFEFVYQNNDDIELATCGDELATWNG